MLKRYLAVAISIAGVALAALGCWGLVEGLRGSTQGTDTSPEFGVLVGLCWIALGVLLTASGWLVAKRAR